MLLCFGEKAPLAIAGAEPIYIPHGIFPRFTSLVEGADFLHNGGTQGALMHLCSFDIRVVCLR